MKNDLTWGAQEVELDHDKTHFQSNNGDFLGNWKNEFQGQEKSILSHN